MKFALFFLLAAAVIGNSAAGSLGMPGQYLKVLADTQLDKQDGLFTADLNEILDSMMDYIGDLFKASGLEPAEMPDVKEGFKAKPAFITYHGELELTQGVLRGLSTVSRAGNASAKYEKKLLRLSMGLKFDKLKLNYNYLAKIMNIGPKGSVYADVDDTEIYFDIIFDLEDFTMYLQSFEIPNVSKIKVNFKGNVLTDWLVNPLMNVTTSIFKNVVRDVMEKEIAKVIKNVINDFNTKDICGTSSLELR